MKRKLKWLALGIAVGFGLLQFTNPPRINPPVVRDLFATNSAPPEVEALLRTACYDCHSDETRWPWYSRVAPMSWLVAYDVNEGRQHLNLSKWPANDPELSAKWLDRMTEAIDYREMPPKKYTIIHADARFTETDRKTLTNWLEAQASRLVPTTTN